MEYFMDIVIGKNTPIQDDAPNAKVLVRQDRKVMRKDHRKNRQDRRQSARDGIIVSLSFKKERRRSGGRRNSDCHTCL
jgi:hypothetical protein